MASTPLLVLCLVVCQAATRGSDYFAIEVVDDQSGRGVPLVELETINGIRLVTDSNGIAAIDEPGLMDKTVYFHIRSHGYEYPKDGFGFRGKALDVRAGRVTRLAIRRINVAERLYRVTGAGIYRDSVLAGRPVPLRQPVLNARVLGSDSVVDAVYHGKIHWFWGDTNRPDYPLGNFHVPGATSRLPADGGLDPDIGVDLTYFEGEDGFARPMAQMPGDGPTWIDGLVVLKDGSGRERMLAAYGKVRNLLDIYERGLVEYDDTAQRFVKSATFAADAPLFPSGHPDLRTVDGSEFVVFASPYPLVRVRANPEDLKRPERYEAFTCLAPGSRLERPRIERNADGTVRYGWKRDTPAIRPKDQAKLVASGLLKADEGILQLRDIATGKTVLAHAGSVAWNAYRGRWVMIAVEESGTTSYLGEVWFAEADAPLGPWVYARKVATHEKYSFYNPKQHPLLAKDGGRRIYFEGTYSQTFSGNAVATPRYDYNQVMYRLDLADHRLNLPVPVYLGDKGIVQGTLGRLDRGTKRLRPAFFALDRAQEGSVPVHAVSDGRVTRLRVGERRGDTLPVLFHALPADRGDPPPTTVPLHEFISRDGAARAYTTDADWSEPGYRLAGPPLCRVWRNPMRLAVPRD